MEQDRKAFIQKLVQEGKSRHEVRTELISLGFGSSGFEEEFKGIIAELGIEEPKHVSKDFSYTPTEKDELKKSEERYARKKGKSIRSLLLVVGVIVVCVVSLIAINTIFVIEPESAEESLDFSDTLMRTNVVSTAASVRVYGGTMGSYDGACADVSVVAPIQCRAESRSYVVYGPIANGRSYCVDGEGYSGVLPSAPTGLTCIIQ